MPEKKDYTKSGVNLCNPPEVKELIESYAQAVAASTKADDVVSKCIPDDIYDAQLACQETVDLARNALKIAVEEHGGYQDVDTETYALFLTRRTAQYHAKPFMERYEQAVPMVIESAINVTALKGLVKGGMLSEDDLIEHGVITYGESNAFILSLPEPKAD